MAQNEFTNDENFEFDVKKGRVTLTDYTGEDTEVWIPDIVNEIGDDAFLGCSAEVINIPESVEKIGSDAFSDCAKLQSAVIPDSVTEIGECLESVELPEGILTIPEDAFYGCGNLKNIVLPDSLKEIGERAFADCEALEDVDLSGTELLTVGDEAFSGCTELKSVCLPDCIKELGDGSQDCDVFDGCEKVSVEYDGNTYRYGQLKSLYIRVNCR